MITEHKKYRPNWSELNQELLELIALKLSYVDILRFKAVCSSWLASTGRISSCPLLILPSNPETNGEEEEDIKIGIFSLKDKTTYELNLVLEKLENYQFVGSSHGWLVILGKHADSYLMNPFSSTSVQLPNILPIARSSESRIQKAILTAIPTSNKNYKVIITYGWRKKLAFWGNGDKCWTVLGDSEDYYDLIWFNSMLYTLRKGVTIEVWDLANSCLPTKKIFVECCYTTNLSFPSDICTTQWYLVPSLGEILFVVRYVGEFVTPTDELLSEADLLIDEDSHPSVCPNRTFKFQVYKQDMIEKKLEQVKTLKDQAIFVGENHGVSLSNQDYQELRGNSIYFIDDYWDRMHEDYLYGGHDFGFFNLEDGSIGSVLECDFLQRFEPTPFWILPN